MVEMEGRVDAWSARPVAAREVFRNAYCAIFVAALGGCSFGDTRAEQNMGEVTQPLLHTGDAGLAEETIEAYASLSNNGADWGPAFQAFLTTSNASRLLLSCDKTYNVGAAAPSNALGACTADGTEVAAAVNICREVTIVGCGRSTVVQTTGGVTAFATRFTPWCATSGGQHGGNSALRDFTIRETTAANTRRYGVLMQAGGQVEDVRIEGFSNGVRVEANVSNNSCLGKSGSNHWTMRRLEVIGADHAGVLVRGPDSNVGDGRSVRAQGNCVNPDRVGANGAPLYNGTTWPACAGLIDDSFLGNTWTGLYSHDNSNRLNAWFGDDSPQVCMGCFSSGAVPAAGDQIETSDKTLVLGGSATFKPLGGVRFSRGVVNNLYLYAPTILPLDEAGDSDLLLAFQLSNGLKLQIEQDPDPLNLTALRGSYEGQNDKVAWRWIGSPPQWIPTL
jgi:hypothetical protein